MLRKVTFPSKVTPLVALNEHLQYWAALRHACNKNRPST